MNRMNSIHTDQALYASSLPDLLYLILPSIFFSTRPFFSFGQLGWGGPHIDPLYMVIGGGVEEDRRTSS